MTYYFTCPECKEAAFGITLRLTMSFEVHDGKSKVIREGIPTTEIVCLNCNNKRGMPSNLFDIKARAEQFRNQMVRDYSEKKD